MDKARIEELAMAVAMVEYYQKIIDEAKDEIRNLTEEEIEKINKNKDLIIKRQDYTKTIYSEEYKQALEEITKKFPPKKEKIANHSIKLLATAYTKSKADIIATQLANKNKTQLKVASKNANIK